MLMVFSLATLAFTTPPGLRALGIRASGQRGAVLQASVDDNLAARVDERWKFLRDNPGMDAAEAAGDDTVNAMQRSKDTLLAERDTRQWCLDRCLATGYCEVRSLAAHSHGAHTPGLIQKFFSHGCPQAPVLPLAGCAWLSLHSRLRWVELYFLCVF